MEGEAMTARAKPNLALRPFLPRDAPLLAEIFRASIAELTGDDYNEGQQEAWAAIADDAGAFAARLAAALTLLGTIDGSPVGFVSLAGTERVDMLYVHPAAARQGVGTMLIDALEKLAAARGAARLTADVSDSAQDFFRRRGFVATQRNTIELGGEWLANTTMEKRLAAKERAQ
jgi:putative acetyltransferase